MDIDLAIERILLYQHIYNDPTVLMKHIKIHKTMAVPDFTIPPYLVDFGNVITGTIVNYTVLILNYGPTNAVVKLLTSSKKNDFEESGLTVEFSRCTITVGSIKELFLTFQPTLDMYPDPYYEVQRSFDLDVNMFSFSVTFLNKLTAIFRWVMVQKYL